jgi:hypothetical protein
MAKQFVTTITHFELIGTKTAASRDENLAAQVKKGYTLFSTVTNDKYIIDTLVKEDGISD